MQYTVYSPWGSWTPRVDVSWQSQMDFNPAPGASAPPPAYTIMPYALTNMQLAYASNDGKWSAIFSVTNLSDKFYYYQLFGGGEVNISSNVGPPREFHFNIRRDF